MFVDIDELAAVSKLLEIGGASQRNGGSELQRQEPAGRVGPIVGGKWRSRRG